MDIYHFLTERLNTIRFLYENAAEPFLENWESRTPNR